MRYSIFDPTGNITALVESDTPEAKQPALALEIMKRHPEVEQVGFVRMASPHDVDTLGVEPTVALHMAGGEFCGNASMSAVALYLMQRDGKDAGLLSHHKSGQSDSWETVWLSVSGATQLVETRLCRQSNDVFLAQINMPAVLRIEARELVFQQLCDTVPVVVMEGISHIVIPDGSAFSGLRNHPFDAEQAVCTWCEELGADGLGVMFVEGEGTRLRMTPLVYVPGSGTIFWENSCASGSAAVGTYWARQQQAPVELTLCEPGGTLCVACDPFNGTTWLRGSVRHVESYDM